MTTMNRAIICAADAGYAELLLDLIHSIRSFPESHELDLCVLDVGMTPAQISQLSPLVTQVVPAKWELDFPALAKCPPWFRAMVDRPFLPRYFPRYELLIWIDADAWVCNWDAIRLLMHAGERDGMAVVPELDRCYGPCFTPRPGIVERLRQMYTVWFDAQTAEDLARRPVINSGVFAMRGDAPFWGIWAELLNQSLHSGRHLS